MPFRNTPHPLRIDHETPLDPDRLETYFSMAKGALEEARTYHAQQDSSHRKKFFIGAGCWTVQRPPRNLISDPEEIKEKLPQALDEFRTIVRGLRKKAKCTVKPPNRGHAEPDGISLKAFSRIDDKAEEYETDEPNEMEPYARIADAVRITLNTDNTKDLQKLSEQTRPCALNGVTRYFNSIMQPDLSPIRRVLVNVRTPCGLNGEIQIRDILSEPFYDASEDQKHKERAANQGMAVGSQRGYGNQSFRNLSKQSIRAKTTREAENQLAASVNRVAVLQSKLEYYSLGGFPIVINHDSWENESFALVPNPVTGLWETDQRFLPLTRSADAEEITPFEARIRAEAITQTLELRNALS